MARVTNMTNQAISIPNGTVDENGAPAPLFLNPRMKIKGDGSQEEVIDPDSSKDATDAGIKKWLKHRLNRAAVSERRIVVELDTAKTEPVAPGDPPVEDSESEHWTQLVKRIATITNPDELEAMYAGETRPGVKKALEERIGQVA